MNKKVKIPVLDEAKWNELLDTISCRLPITCVRVGRKWTHPWFVSPQWQSKDLKAEDTLIEGEWVFRINPGFVNGVDPEVTVPAKYAATATIDRINDKTGKRPENDKLVTAWLTEKPIIRLGSSRIIGKGAEPEEVITTDDGAVSYKFEGVPEFFTQFGVTPESVVFTGQLNSGIQIIAPTASKEKPPVLRAVDVVLEVDRLSAKLDILRGNGFLDSYNALYFLTFGRTTPAKDRPTLRATAKFIPKTEVNIGSFTQETSDDENDSLKIATVYFLSPLDTPIESVLNGKWRTFVKHETFWNLAHAPAILPETIAFESLSVVTLLAGGLANPIFSGILSTINDNLSIASALVKTPNLSGRFWSL